MSMEGKKRNRPKGRQAPAAITAAPASAPKPVAAAAGYDAGKAALKPKPKSQGVAGPQANASKGVDFENLVVVSSTTLVPEMGLSGVQRAQMEAGIAYISSADEAFEFTDERSFTVDRVKCPATGQEFTRYTYYAGDTFCGFIVDPGTANVRARIEDGDVQPA